MEDTSVHDHINRLVNEEHELLARGERGTLDEGGRARLHEIEVRLDQLWDLLHQRQGLRDAGSDPEHARIRPASVVEGYVE